MIHKIYSVYDSKVEAYLQPFYARAHGEAIRSFEGACGNPEHQFAVTPEDYALFYLGEFDDANGVFDVVVLPLVLAKAHEVVAARSASAVLK